MEANAARVAVVFPSPEFERRVTELRAAIANDRSELDTAQKKLAAMIANPGALTAIGRDAAVEIQNARTGIQALERQISVKRSQITQLFRDEHRAIEQHRDETWRTLYEDFVQPTSSEILEMAAVLNTKMRAIVALVKSRPVELSTLLDSFKTSEAKWNQAVRDFGNLGIGGNLAVQSDLHANVAHALAKVIKENFGP